MPESLNVVASSVGGLIWVAGAGFSPLRPCALGKDRFYSTNNIRVENGRFGGV
jgi:hypothetical protein